MTKWILLCAIAALLSSCGEPGADDSGSAAATAAADIPTAAAQPPADASADAAKPAEVAGPSKAAPAKLEGLDYAEARTFILGQGWQPLPGDCGGGGTSSEICASYPETGNCSGTGIGNCDMTFVKEAKCLVIISSGGPPGDGAVVDDVLFQPGPCSKNP